VAEMIWVAIPLDWVAAGDSETSPRTTIQAAENRIILMGRSFRLVWGVLIMRYAKG
jgi:hypothetical protein